MGGGWEIEMMWDLIIEGRNEKLGKKEIKMGEINGMGG